MAATRRSRNSKAGGLALVLWFLTQSSLYSAQVSTRAEAAVRATATKFPAFSFSTLPRFSLPPIPQFQLPQIPHFALRPPPIQVTLPCLNVPQLSSPPLQPPAFPRLHLPPLPQPTLPIPRLPFTTVFPRLSSFLIPKISISSLSARTSTIPNLNPADLTVPGLTIPSDISPLPSATLTLPPPVVFPTFGGFPRRAALGARAQSRP